MIVLESVLVLQIRHGYPFSTLIEVFTSFAGSRLPLSTEGSDNSHRWTALRHYHTSSYARLCNFIILGLQQRASLD
jgi:hypothetical protein